MTADRSTEPLSTFQFSVKSNCLTYSKHDKFKVRYGTWGHYWY